MARSAAAGTTPPRDTAPSSPPPPARADAIPRDPIPATGSGPAAPARLPAVDPEVARTLHLQRSPRLRRLIRRVVLALLALAALALVVRWWQSRHAPKVWRWVTEPASRGDLVVTVTATGTLEPRNQVDVGSEVSGRIARVLVDFNDRVGRGQILAEIDPETFAAQVAQARAQLATARAQLATARVTRRETAETRARADGLFRAGLMAGQDHEAAVAAADRAAAAVDLATAQEGSAAAALRVAETNLTRTVIRAPIDGIVLARNVEPGQTVVAALQAPVLFQLAEDLRAMQVAVDVDEADVGQVRAGQPATFTVAAYFGREFHARVVAVHNAARLVDRVVSYEAELEVDNRELLLRPGMTVTAQIVVDRVHDALLVPAQALRFDPPGIAHAGPPRLWVLAGGGPVAVPVRAGPGNETMTSVDAGAVTPGTPVIVNAR